MTSYPFAFRAVFTWLSKVIEELVWFWFYCALWLASVFTLVLVLRQSSENRSISWLGSCAIFRWFKGSHVIGVNVFPCTLRRFLSKKRPDLLLLHYSFPSCARVESTPSQEVGSHRIYLSWRSNNRLSTKLGALSICQDWPASPFPSQWAFHF